jgi:uncharacterized membrane protein
MPRRGRLKMDDFAGILVLLALALLAVPVLLVVALVKIGNAKARIDALERGVEQLHGRLREVESARGAPAVSSRDGGVRAQRSMATAPPARTDKTWRDDVVSADSAPDAIKRDPLARDGFDAGRVSAAVGESDPAYPDASASRRARFDLPDDPAPPAETTGAMPPPLPPRRKLADPVASAAARQARRPQSPPPPDVVAKAFDWIRGWFTEGNVPVKIGMLVLFFGVASLLKYASDQGWVRVPIELRLAAVAAAAIAGLVFAWRQRETRRSFSLSVQGGAIGVLMLVTFAAYKLYGVIPAGAAFGITIALVAGIGVLAVLQNALALAVFGILAGFLAPIWLSTGSGNHVALFGYYAVLNLGIFGIAWNRPWRLLNLLGFVFTFGIGTVWGVLDYQPAKFASTEPFLLLFFALYLLIPIFYAHRRNADGHDEGNAHALVDGTLVFGTPLVAFALQAGLLQGERMPLALSALGAAAIYALLAAALRRREQFASLVDTYAVLAVGFSTLSVPLALSARATASVFALEGAALVWLGVRQERRLPQIAGLLLQLAAAAAYVAGVGGIGSGFSQSGLLDTVANTPIANPAFMGALLIALAGFATAWTYRNEHDGGLVGLLTLWAFGWWSFAGAQEIVDHIAYPDRVDALFAFVAFTGWIAAELRRRESGMTVLGGIAAAALALGIPAALLLALAHHHPFGGFGAAAWLVYAVLGWRSLICLRATGEELRFVAHGGWLWSWVAAIAVTALHFAGEAELGDGWQWIGFGLPLLAFAALLQLRPALLAPPLAQTGGNAGEQGGFEDYRRWLLGSAWLVLAMSWCVSLFFPGESVPLPWIALLNPLELLQIATLALLAQRVWAGRGTMGSQTGVAVFALAAFAWVTFATLRATHHWGGTDWSPSMLDDSVVQTALTVVWSVLGVLGWIFGSKRGDRLLWGAGAVLMGVVLLKLLLIDRGHLGNLFGIVSFIAYGLLCTAVGYFAPAPPRRAASTEEISA